MELAYRQENFVTMLREEDYLKLNQKRKMDSQKPNTLRLYTYGTFTVINIFVGIARIIQGSLWKRIYCDNEEVSDIPQQSSTKNQLNLVALYLFIQGVVLIICTVVAHSFVLKPFSKQCCVLYLMIWFVMFVWGSVLISTTWYDHESAGGELHRGTTYYNKCDKSLLLFAFCWLIYAWLQTIVYLVYATFVVLH